MQAKIMSLEAQLNKANQQIKELEGKSTADSKAEVKPEGTEASGEFYEKKSTSLIFHSSQCLLYTGTAVWLL